MLEDPADELRRHLPGGLRLVVKRGNHGKDRRTRIGGPSHVADVDLVQGRFTNAQHQPALLLEADIGGPLDQLVCQAIGDLGKGTHTAGNDHHRIGRIRARSNGRPNIVVIKGFDLGGLRSEKLLEQARSTAQPKFLSDHAKGAIGGNKVRLFNTLVGFDPAQHLPQEDRAAGSRGCNCEDQGCRTLRGRISDTSAVPLTLSKFMATTSTLRFRRNSAQLHALAEVERTIRATDPNSRRKYLREFTEAFQSYHSVLSPAQVREQLTSSDIVLIGDYHALPSSQMFCEKVITHLAAEGPVVLGLETVFARDQHLLDAWSSREIDGAELRERLRYDIDWGYDWFPFYRLLETARANCRKIYGLDCCPRNDLRKIARRDQHAAARLRRIRKENPGAVIVVLFGESHLAPTHLPREVCEALPEERVTTVLQNVDALYWKAGGERRDHVEAVQVREDVLCVFNATPLEKYESYRMYLERWTREPRASLDLAPTVLNLVDALLQFLNIDKYSATAGSSGQALVDVFPEVVYRQTEAAIAKLILRKRGASELRTILECLRTQGCCFSPRLNTFFLRHFEMLQLTEEIAWYVHRACRGAIGKSVVNGTERSPRDKFYESALESALRVFGSRVLYPGRPVLREEELYSLYSQDHGAFPRDEFDGMIDFLIMHKDYEAHRAKYWRTPLMIERGIESDGKRFDYLTKHAGELLGNRLYEAYLAGQISKRTLRAFYFADLTPPGAAEATYFDLARRCAKSNHRFAA